MFKKLIPLWPLVTITLVVAIFFYPVIFENKIPLPADFVVGTYYPWLDYKWAGYNAGVPVKNPITTDVVSFIYPMQMYALDQLKQGTLPLWNNLILAGTPLLANFQSAPFSPTNFLYFIFPQLTAWSLQIIAQPFLAAVFLYLLLRHLQRSQLAAIGGGILYAFAGFLTIWMQWNGHALVAAFFPLIILLVLKWLSTEKLIFGIVTSLALALQLFSGYPQIIFYEFVAIGLLIATTNKEKFLNPKKISLLTLFIIIGIGLAGVQIVPGFELLSNSQRSIEIIENKWAFLPWQLIIIFIAPDYFGNHATYNYWGPADYTLTTGYSGVVTIILASIGFLVWLREKSVKFAAALILFALAVAFPNPISVALKESGFLGSQAASTHRVLVLSNLGFAILAAFGLDSLILHKAGLKEIIRSAYVPAILLGSFGIGTFISWRISNIENFEVALRNLVFPSFFLLTTLLILILGLILKKYRQFVPILLIFLATLELFRFGWKFTPFSEEEFVYPETPVLNFLLSQTKPFRVAAEDVIPINMMMPYDIETIEGYDAVYPLNFARYLSALNAGRVDTDAMGRYGSVSSVESRLLDLANVRYLLALKKDKSGKPTPDGDINERFKTDKLKPVFEDRSVVVLENTQVLPRAFFVTEWKTIADKQEILKTLLDKNFPQNQEIIIEKEFNQFSKSSENLAEVDILQHTGVGDIIKVKVNNPGFLFISDNWYPGWKAEVDNRPTEMLRANFTFRAIPVDSGDHIVKTFYQPLSLTVGAWISFISLVILGMIVVIRKKYE